MKSSNHKFEKLKKELKAKWYNDETIQMYLRWGVFPYEYISDDNWLMMSKLSAKQHLCSELKGENMIIIILNRNYS